jgi:hypothetical protein
MYRKRDVLAGEEPLDKKQRKVGLSSEGLQIADDLDDHFFENDQFMKMCMELKRETKAFMAPYKDVHKDKQKKANQPKIIFFTTSSVSAIRHILYVVRSP